MCKLKKSIYGLKQYSVWHDHVSSGTLIFFIDISESILLLVYVDDIILTGNDKKGISELKVFLNTQF